MTRNLIKTICNDCGSWHETFYDKANDYYICQECLNVEEQVLVEGIERELSEDEDGES